jgi:hypothetical protein
MIDISYPPIPKYWQAHLNEKIERIQTLQKALGNNGFSFGMITDLHWSHNAQNSPAILTKILTECNISYFFNGGDTVASAPYCDKEFIRSEFVSYEKAFQPIMNKCLMTIGNHDGVYSILPPPHSYRQNLTKAERFEYFFRTGTQYNNRIFGEDYTYFYVDETEKKVRYIVLNTHDVPSDEIDENGYAKYNTFGHFCIRQTQLSWLAHVALNVPSKEWSVVLCSHENATVLKPYHKTRNHSLILGIIDAFRRKKAFHGETDFDDQPYYSAKIDVDFTQGGGNFIAWIAGHEHVDRILSEDGIISVCTRTDSCKNANGVIPPHELGTITEQAFDIFTVDKKRNKVYVTRVGFGEDRQFDFQTF